MLDTLAIMAMTMGLHFSKDKIEVCKWSAPWNEAQVIWGSETIPVRTPICQYLGHIMARKAQREGTGLGDIGNAVHAVRT